MMKRALTQYFSSWWLPTLVYLGLLAGFVITAIAGEETRAIMASVLVLFFTAALAFLGLIATAIWSLIKKRWSQGVTQIFLLLACGAVTVYAVAFVVFASMFGPSEDGFADALTIPEGIDISEPDEESQPDFGLPIGDPSDEFQMMVRKALATPGSDVTDVTPSMPSLRTAATDHAAAFRDYIEASPDWHVFVERGNHFAARRWSSAGEPQDELHGYISEFYSEPRFQTRCLLCLDRKQWSRYSVQHEQEGTAAIKPEIEKEHEQFESRVMIECGGVWVEIFEESDKPERRVTKATVAALEKEFSEFVSDPQAAVERARARALEFAKRLAGKVDQLFGLRNGMQPGIYEVAYSLNPGEPGETYLKAFEVTNDTPLSASRLKSASTTRMTWSADPSERFGATAGFTIYEGDWGKPYAARFEVWLQPDSGQAERKLAERIFKIEGWQR
jgi:hypothetical protein